MTFVPLGNPLSDTLFKLQAAETFYFRQDWLNLITKLYGYSLLPLTVTNSAGRITGFLPLCYIQSRITGSGLVSLPFSDDCPLLAEDDNCANELIDQAVRLVQQYRIRYLELRTGANNVLKKRKTLLRVIYIHVGLRHWTLVTLTKVCTKQDQEVSEAWCADPLCTMPRGYVGILSITSTDTS